MAAAIFVSCRKDDSIGGSVNSTEQLDIPTYEWMLQTDETEVVARLFEKAGLKDKDIITKVNGVVIGSSGSLANLISEYKPGDTVQLTVIRDGKEIAVNVTLEGYSDK